MDKPVCLAIDWINHRAETQQAIVKVNEMHYMMHNIAQHTKHLEKLDIIANAIGKLDDDLIGPATGRKQVPLSSHIFMMLILGITLLVVLVEKSNKTIQITPSGITIERDTSGKVEGADWTPQEQKQIKDVLGIKDK